MFDHPYLREAAKKVIILMAVPFRLFTGRIKREEWGESKKEEKREEKRKGGKKRGVGVKIRENILILFTCLK